MTGSTFKLALQLSVQQARVFVIDHKSGARCSLFACFYQRLLKLVHLLAFFTFFLLFANLAHSNSFMHLNLVHSTLLHIFLDFRVGKLFLSCTNATEKSCHGILHVSLLDFSHRFFKGLHSATIRDIKLLNTNGLLLSASMDKTYFEEIFFKMW